MKRGSSAENEFSLGNICSANDDDKTFDKVWLILSRTKLSNKPNHLILEKSEDKTKSDGESDQPKSGCEQGRIKVFAGPGQLAFWGPLDKHKSKSKTLNGAAGEIFG
jgi:hypothetical protein